MVSTLDLAIVGRHDFLLEFSLVYLIRFPSIPKMRYGP